jgi:photosystem II stability/assembly factor-like uncharacterized protein
VEDLTWISDTHGWALVYRPGCGGSGCSAIDVTTDGGADWTQTATIAANNSDCQGCAVPSVTHLRFANALDGYAFGPDLFTTTDGGRSWVEQPGDYVAALEPAGSTVLRVAFTHSGCPGPCDLVVQEAEPGGSAWQNLTTPVQGDAVQLVRGDVADAYVSVFLNPAGGASDAHASLMITHDGGASWSTRPDPCGARSGQEYDTVAVTAAPGRVVDVLCRDRAEAFNTFVAASDDGGADFVAGSLIPGSPPFTELAATSASGVVVGESAPVGTTTTYGLVASNDAGRTWTQVASTLLEQVGVPPATSSFLGFESPTVGRWVVGNDVWQTTDGGSSWGVIGSP